MTYNDDERLRSNTDPLKTSDNRTVRTSGVSPFLLVAIAFALVLGGLFLFTGNNTNTASNQNGTTVNAPARVNPPASTTGSGSTSPASPANPATPPASR